MISKTKLPVYLATLNDIPILVMHHHIMFEEIWALRGFKLDTLQFEAMDKEYEKKLQKEIVNGKCKAWIIKNGKKIVASGAMSIISMVPTPYDSSYKVAYLHSIFTECEYRNRGCAQLISENSIQYCKSQGIKRMILEASDAGRPIYEKIGFQSSTSSMRLLIE